MRSFSVSESDHCLAVLPEQGVTTPAILDFVYLLFINSGEGYRAAAC